MALVCLCRGNFYWPPHTTILFCSIFLDKIVLDTLKSRYHRSAPLGIRKTSKQEKCAKREIPLQSQILRPQGGERTILYICHLLGSGFQICFKGCDFSFLQVVRDRHINIERGRYIGVTKHRLHDLYIQTALAHSCSECMP